MTAPCGPRRAGGLGIAWLVLSLSPGAAGAAGAEPQDAASSASQQVEKRHLKYSFYQDHARSRDHPTRTEYLWGKSVKLLELQSRRLPGLDEAAKAFNDPQQKCIVGSATPGHCRGFGVFNPGLAAAEGGGFWMISRASNWTLCDWSGNAKPYTDFPDTKYPNAVFEEYHSHMLVQRLDEKLRPVAAARHLRPAPATWDTTRTPFFEIFRQGLEDPRLVELPSGLHALVSYGVAQGSKHETRLAPPGQHASTFRQALLALGKAGAALEDLSAPLPERAFVPMMAGFAPGEQQKNWMPFTYRGELFAVHQLAPVLQVLHVNASSGATYLDFESPTPQPLRELQERHRAALRGGTPAVWLEEHGFYITVAHVTRGRTMYTHVFLALQGAPPFPLVAASREWCVAHQEDLGRGRELLCEGVQFVSGLVRDGDRLVLTYGAQDCDARIAAIPVERAVKALRFFDGGDRAKAARTEL